MFPKCSIDIYENGIIVIGWIDMRYLKPILKIAKDLKFDLCDGKIAHHFKASMCITNQANSEIWRKELKIEEDSL